MKLHLILLLALAAPIVTAAPAKKLPKSVKKAPVLVWPRISQADRFSYSATNVTMLQLLLRHRGFYKSEPDDVFGPKTQAAVKAFQKQSGLKADGVVGPQTWEKLVVRVKRGDKGDAVRAAQYLFGFSYSEAGYEIDNLTSDGDGFFGPKTEKAVRDLQKHDGLKPDGVVGLQTWCILLGGKVKK